MYSQQHIAMLFTKNKEQSIMQWKKLCGRMWCDGPECAPAAAAAEAGGGGCAGCAAAAWRNQVLAESGLQAQPCHQDWPSRPPEVTAQCGWHAAQSAALLSLGWVQVPVGAARGGEKARAQVRVA